MDKYEFNLKIEQIKKLIKAKDYANAAEIADSFSDYKIKDNRVLTMLADVYEASGNYDRAKEKLMEAYERVSLGRQLSYRLVRLSLKSGNIPEAEEFYDNFIRTSPRDNSRYILEYEIAKAKGIPIADRINILTNYLTDEMDEKWSFELAKLYHQSGQKDKCVEQCDMIILWFSDGKYVERAMELKMQYTPLTKAQQEQYDAKWIAKAISNVKVEDIKIKELDVNNKYNTTNIQEAIKKSMSEILRNKDDFKSESNSLLSHTIKNPLGGVINTVPLEPIYEIGNNGQIELSVDEIAEEPTDEQIEGQLTIEELLNVYEEREKSASYEEILQQRKEEDYSLMEDIENSESDEEEEAEEIIEVELEEESEIESEAESEYISEMELMAENYLEELPEVPIFSEPSEEENEEETEEELEKDLEEAEEEIEEDSLEEVEDGGEEEVVVKEKTTREKNEEIKDTIKEFVGKFSGVQGLDKQLLKILQESMLKDNNKLVMKGEVKCGKTCVAIDLIKIINKIRQSRGRKIAKINGKGLNGKDVKEYYDKLMGIDIVIEKAGSMEPETVNQLIKAIEEDTENKIIILEDEKNSVERVLDNNEKLLEIFKNTIHIKQNKIKDWAEYALSYAGDKGYEIEEMGTLALHASIDKLYAITLVIQKEHVEKVVDDAIKKSERRGVLKILRFFGKKGDGVLREEDFS